MAEFYLYENYPEGMKDHEIIQHVREYTNIIIKSGAQVNTVWQLSPLIQLGQYELEKRQSKRITRLTVGISIVSMCVAATALWIATQSSRASERWETSQIQILKSIEKEVSGNSEVVLKRASEVIPENSKELSEKSAPDKKAVEPGAETANKRLQIDAAKPLD